MITRVFLGARRADMTPEACLSHWRGKHAAIGARLPGVRAYVQNHGVLADGRFLLPYPGFDIMPELDWDDLAAMDAAMDSSAHDQEAVDDEAKFIDGTRTGHTVTTRRVLAGGAPPDGAVKLITFLRRGANASLRALGEALTGPYAEAVAGNGSRRHEVLMSLPDREGRPAFAVQAIDMLWFVDERDALAWVRSERAAKAAWLLAGVAFGAERLVARPHKIV